ncbi:MAG: DMT family transporter [Ktedonobacteraceae bacterium]|nr:DMT family transporter [Ktedonobacteraceae bacterium]
MGIFLGLVAAVGWGAGDFLARHVTHRIGTYRTLLFIQLAGVCGLSVFLLSTGELQHLLAGASWQAWAWAMLAVLLNVLSTASLYRAFEVGTLMLVSPIAASYAAVTVLLAVLSGETLSHLHDIGIGIVLLGVIAAATPLVKLPARQELPDKGKSKAVPGIIWALLAAVSYGITFWLLGFRVTPVLGSVVPIWLIRLMTPCLLTVCAPLLRQSIRLPRGRIWWAIIGVSVLDTLAYVAYAFGITLGQVSIITVLSSLYSVVTVILAWIFLREQLQSSQWFGVGAIFVGVALVNM